MRRNKIAWLIVSLMALALFAAHAPAADLAAKKVVIISGVSEASAPGIGYNMVYDGLNEGFKASGIVPVYQWVEMDTLPSDEAKAAAGVAAIAKAREVKPDLIITLNDDALKFIGAKIDDIPVVFAWIFGAPNTLGMPKDNVTGIIRVSYAADIWKMANKLMGAKTVALISKYSASMDGIKKVLAARADQLEKDSGVRYKDMFLCNTFEEWAKSVNTFPYDFIYLADTSRIIKDGKELSRQETAVWTVENSKVPVIAAAEGDVAAGALYSIVTSEKGIGTLAAEEALKILSGAAPDPVYKQSKKGKLVVNMKTAQKYKIEIPYDILSTAEKVYE